MRYLYIFGCMLLLFMVGCGGGNGGGEGNKLGTVFPSGSTNSGNTDTTSTTPTGVAAVASGTSVNLSWTPVSGATSYTVYWNTSAGVTKSSNKIPNVSGVTYQQTGCTDGVKYYYAITANMVSGESALSAEVSTTISNATKITLGTTQNDVVKIQGTPTAIENYSSFIVYRYGSDSLQLNTSDKTVISWSNTNKTLNILMTPGSNATSATKITIGTTLDDVINIQGTPTVIENYSSFIVYRYGSDYLQLSTSDKTVISWSNTNKTLNILMTPGSNTTSATQITLGTTLDDVIKIQGTPTVIENYSSFIIYRYGSDYLQFSTSAKTVTAWSNTGGTLLLADGSSQSYM